MKLILGLGNPGKDYSNTRHNAGFFALDEIAKQWDAPAFSLDKQMSAETTKVHWNDETWILARPQTFMNLSGEAAHALVDFYKLKVEEDIVVVYDDIDLPLGEIRTTGTSSGGHKGMTSIFGMLATENVKRIRIGIDSPDKPEQIDTSDFVLQKFTKKELKGLEAILKKIPEHVEQIFA